MRTDSANPAALTGAGRDGRQAPAAEGCDARDRMRISALLLGRRRIRPGKPVASVGASRATELVPDQRAVERARALLGCAVRGIRPPGDW